MALASRRNRLRYGFVVTDKTEFSRPQAKTLRPFYLLAWRRLTAWK
jgi:hypothetical protein